MPALGASERKPTDYLGKKSVETKDRGDVDSLSRHVGALDIRTEGDDIQPWDMLADRPGLGRAMARDRLGFMVEKIPIGCPDRGQNRRSRIDAPGRDNGRDDGELGAGQMGRGFDRGDHLSLSRGRSGSGEAMHRYDCTLLGKNAGVVRRLHQAVDIRVHCKHPRGDHTQQVEQTIGIRLTPADRAWRVEGMLSYLHGWLDLSVLVGEIKPRGR